MHFKGQQLVYSKDTPYGNVAVTQTNGQYNFYENSTLVFSTDNTIMPEEAVHFTLLQRSSAEKVMIVSGGLTSMVPQVLKYTNVLSVDYFEINPWLIHIEEKYLQTPVSNRLRVVTKDARQWLKKCNKEYDAVLINAPDPSSAQINRYFTLEFFQEVKKALKQSGVISISLSSTANYMSKEALEINRMVFRTLNQVFSQVVILPGERNYFLASDSSLRTDIAKAVQEAGVENDMVNGYYINDLMLMKRSNQMKAELESGPAEVNSDLSPQAYLLQIVYWWNTFKGRSLFFPALILFLMAGIITLALRKARPVAFGVFTGGFAGAAAEFLVLIMFQVFFGYIYQMIGLIVACYMIGLTTGALCDGKWYAGNVWNKYIGLQCLLLVLVLFVPLVATLPGQIHNLQEWVLQSALLSITFFIALTTGLEFNLAGRLEPGSPGQAAGILYSLDLAGASTGTMVVSLLFFPLLGLWKTCLIMAGLVFGGMLYLLFSGKPSV
jgi:spermidine synthase